MKIDWRRFIPGYIDQSYPTDWEWDEVLNALMDKYPIQIESEYTVLFGKTEVWIKNYPYAFGTLRGTNKSYLPSVKTRIRLHKLIQKQKDDAAERQYREALEKAKRSLND